MLSSPVVFGLASLIGFLGHPRVTISEEVCIDWWINKMLLGSPMGYSSGTTIQRLAFLWAVSCFFYIRFVTLRV